MLNRPLHRTLGEMDGDYALGPLAAVPVFQGGPVQTDQMILAAWRLQDGGFQLHFGLDPTKIDLSIVPERLRITDVGTGKRIDGTEQQHNYGAVLIAIAKLAPTGVSVSEFSQLVAAEIKAGVAGSSSNLLKGFADNYSATVKNTVVPAMQTKIASPPSPGAFPWDSAVWDSATWY